MASDPNPGYQARRDLDAELDAEQASRRTWLLGFAILATVIVVGIGWKAARHVVAYQWLASNSFDVSWTPDPGPWMLGGSTSARYMVRSFRMRSFSASDLSQLRKLHRLDDLDLSNLPEVSDNDLAFLGELTSLKRLFLDRSRPQGGVDDHRLTDATLARIGQLSRLTELQFGGNAITDAGLASLAKLGELRSLDLRMTPITDAGVESLKALPALADLDLSGTNASARGIAAFEAARPGVKVIHDGNTPEFQR
jgi:hypothetical protein